MKNIFKTNQSGFTVLELLVSIGIFAFMTALLVARYGTFNQGVLLNNLAYDIALTIRNAQSYGLNVKSANRSTNEFLYPYGVSFDKATGSNTFFIFYADKVADGVYVPADDILLSKTNMRNGFKITDLYRDSPPVSVNKLDVTYKRPDPNAIIKVNGASGNTYSIARIKVSATDGSYRNIDISSVGQISVTQ